MDRSGQFSLEGMRVLILEDEFFIADDLAQALRRAGAEPVGPAGSVKQAEALILHERLDAAILDLNVRGQMASDFVERLAASNLPCLIVSGYASDAVPAAVSQVPRLEKPVSPTVVIESLSAELRRAA